MMYTRLLQRNLQQPVAWSAAVLFAAVGLVGVALPAGCASVHREFTALGETWDHAVEVRFPASQASKGEGIKMRGAPEADVEVVGAPDIPMPPVHRVVRAAAAVAVFAVDRLGFSPCSRTLLGVPDRGDTKYTLIPGTYAFEYAAGRVEPVWGEIHLYPVSTPRARDFIRHSSINLTPSPSGRGSVLSQADLDRARNGDVVTKVVFMADLGAIRDRLDKIDRGLRELDRVRKSLEEQESYWARRLTDRRMNARYSVDFGWGVDVPSGDLALLQAIVGPERYHWHRFNQAEDQVRTYEDQLAQLELPQRRLKEEREALRHMLGAARVLHRSNDLMVLTDSMIRPYKDPVHEVNNLRGLQVWGDLYRDKLLVEPNDWIGPFGKVHFPYWYSSLPNALLPPAFRPVSAPSLALTKNVGQVLMVVQVGSRRPPELGGHSWVGTK
ncbi:MAG: hypothetical protein IID43_01640 [Planctomycetes bacterium]|nr:hypothetical protein [Planctomycetota bacterium]